MWFPEMGNNNLKEQNRADYGSLTTQQIWLNLEINYENFGLWLTQLNLTQRDKNRRLAVSEISAVDKTQEKNVTQQ